MKLKLYLLIILITNILLKEEGNTTKSDKKEVKKEIKKEVKKEVKKEEKKENKKEDKKENKKEDKKEEKVVIENYDEEKGYFPGNKIYELNDLIFDHLIRDGKIYRWFILLYSKTCGHCMRAKKEIKKIFEEQKNNNTLRFAEIEAYDNTLTNVRFNITGVPYIILVENNTLLELDLYPNYENLKKYIFTNFSEVKDEIKPLPKRVKFHYVAWVIFKQTLDSVTSSFNNFLKRKGIKIQFNPYAFILTVLLTIIVCCVGCIKCCIYCCCNDEDIARELKMLEEQYNLELEKRKKERGEKAGEGSEDAEGEEGEDGEEGGEIEDDEEGEEEEDDEGEEVEDGEKKKEISEEEKKKIEEDKKEEEMRKKEEEKKKKEEEEKKKKLAEEEKKKNENKEKKKKKKKKD